MNFEFIFFENCQRQQSLLYQINGQQRVLSTQECMQKVLQDIGQMRTLFTTELRNVSNSINKLKNDVCADMMTHTASLSSLNDRLDSIDAQKIPQCISGEYRSVSTLSNDISHNLDASNSYIQVYDVDDMEWANAITAERSALLSDSRAMSESIRTSPGLDFIDETRFVRLFVSHLTNVLQNRNILLAAIKDHFIVSKINGEMINKRLADTFKTRLTREYKGI